MIGQFCLHWRKDAKYCCITHLLQSGVKNVLKKIGHDPNGGQIVKSQEITVFIKLSCWISSGNGNRLSIPNCTQTRNVLQSLSLTSSYTITER